MITLAHSTGAWEGDSSRCCLLFSLSGLSSTGIFEEGCCFWICFWICFRGCWGGEYSCGFFDEGAVEGRDDWVCRDEDGRLKEGRDEVDADTRLWLLVTEWKPENDWAGFVLAWGF